MAKHRKGKQTPKKPAKKKDSEETQEKEATTSASLSALNVQRALATLASKTLFDPGPASTSSNPTKGPLKKGNSEENSESQRSWSPRLGITENGPVSTSYNSKKAQLKKGRREKNSESQWSPIIGSEGNGPALTSSNPTKGPLEKDRSEKNSESQRSGSPRIGSEGSGSQRVGQKGKDKVADQSNEYIQKLLKDEETQITLLISMKQYLKAKERFPFTNSVALQDFITNWLKQEVPVKELLDAILALKRRFKKMAQDLLERVGDPGTHERQAFDLANRLWGGQGTKGDLVPNMFLGTDYKFLLSSLKDYDMDFVAPHISDCPIETMYFIKKEDLEALEEQWMELRIEETGNCYKRADFISEQTKLILEAVDQNDNNGEKGKEEDGGGKQDLSAFPFLKEWLNPGMNIYSSWMPKLRENLIKGGLNLMGREKLKEMDNNWKKLLVEEGKLALKRNDLCKEQGRIWLEALKAI
ncbi:mediator-associated protein 1 [Quillaja saponaria]|uniref:Mediator-associated protein 1 n=1 Tax=Quillaja saponaria TaxID=32244 RepID=A0AAD7QHH2_QUISA|nr:mediator-associated protein 1 [Quillaja saponaria]